MARPESYQELESASAEALPIKNKDDTMKAKTLKGSETDLNENSIESLKKSLQGPMILPGEDGYDQSRSVWNAMIDRRPVFVVRCLGVADVITCVQFARLHNLLCVSKAAGTISLAWQR